jgi:hypothetical protein
MLPGGSTIKYSLNVCLNYDVIQTGTASYQPQRKAEHLDTSDNGDVNTITSMRQPFGCIAAMHMTCRKLAQCRA